MAAAVYQEQDIDSTRQAFIVCAGRKDSECVPQHLELVAARFDGLNYAGCDLLVNVYLVLHPAEALGGITVEQLKAYMEAFEHGTLPDFVIA